LPSLLVSLKLDHPPFFLLTGGATPSQGLVRKIQKVKSWMKNRTLSHQLIWLRVRGEYSGTIRKRHGKGEGKNQGIHIKRKYGVMSITSIIKPWGVPIRPEAADSQASSLRGSSEKALFSLTTPADFHKIYRRERPSKRTSDIKEKVFEGGGVKEITKSKM